MERAYNNRLKATINLSKRKMIGKARAMRFEQIRPFVRFVRSIRPSADGDSRFVVARDCRLMLMQAGRQTAALSTGASYPLFPGDCLYLPAGTPYRLIPEKADPARFYVVNFDFTWDHRAFSQPLPLLSPGGSEEIFSPPSLEDAPYFGHPLLFSQMRAWEPALQEMEREFGEQRLYFAPRVSAQLLSLLTLLARAQRSEQPRHPQAVEDMLQWIRAHSAQRFSNQEIAQAVNYHPNYANQLFVRHTGQTLHQYALACRVQNALELLLSTDLSMTEIAARTGFSSLSRFTKEFSARTGNAPSRYRAKRNH